MGSFLFSPHDQLVHPSPGGDALCLHAHGTRHVLGVSSHNAILTFQRSTEHLSPGEAVLCPNCHLWQHVIEVPVDAHEFHRDPTHRQDLEEGQSGGPIKHELQIYAS